MSPNIEFFYEETECRLKDENKIKDWLSSVAKAENRNIEFLNYIICSDDYLLEINKKYLKHFYYTDVITFPYNEDEKSVAGDCFISIDRVYDNANKFEEPQLRELYRVVVHGLLHLIGYNDKTEMEKEIMTGKENYYLKP